jgi:hypothetical protein
MGKVEIVLLARWLTAGVLLLAGVLAGASPAAASSSGKRAVHMTFAVSVDRADRGAVVTLSGRAWRGQKRNAGKVDVHFRKAGTSAWVAVTSTRSSAAGRFRAVVRAESSGTFRAVYRGNKFRKAAARSDALAVHVMREVTRTVGKHSVTGADCDAPAPNACAWTGPTITIADAPLKLSWSITCNQPKSGGILVGFLDSPTNELPKGDNPMSGPGWQRWSYSSPGQVDLTPPITRGHLHVQVSGGTAYYPDLGDICDWSITASQTVTERVRV